jgi:hypothetical protein
MKKLAIIGTVVTAVAVSLVVAPAAAAKPTGISPAQLHALKLRASLSDQQLTLERGQSERFAVGNPLRHEGVNPKYGMSGVQALTLERGLNERFASDNPLKQDLVGSTPPPAGAESSDFQWGDAGIGAGALLGLMALLGTGVVAVRHRGHLRTS